MAETEVGEYVVQAHARYVPDAGKWQPILCMMRLRGDPEASNSQTFNYLPALFDVETDALLYCFTKGKALARGEVIGLTI